MRNGCRVVLFPPLSRKCSPAVGAAPSQGAVAGAGTDQIWPCRSERATAKSAPPHSPTSHLSAHTRSPYSASRPRGRVILKMSVQIPDGRKGTIHVFPGDDPRDLATNFCTKYELKDPKLQRLVERHITDSMKNLPQARAHTRSPGPATGHRTRSVVCPAHQPPMLRQNSSRKSRSSEDVPQPPGSAPGASAPRASSAAADETPPPPPAEPSEPPPNSPPHSNRPAPPKEPPPPQEPPPRADDGAGGRVGDSGDYPAGFLSASRLWEAGRGQGRDQVGDHGGAHGGAHAADHAADDDAAPPLTPPTPPTPLPPAGTAARARHVAVSIGWRAAQRARMARCFGAWAARRVSHQHEVRRDASWIPPLPRSASRSPSQPLPSPLARPHPPLHHPHLHTSTTPTPTPTTPTPTPTTPPPPPPPGRCGCASWTWSARSSTRPTRGSPRSPSRRHRVLT